MSEVSLFSVVQALGCAQILVLEMPLAYWRPLQRCRGYSKLRTHTALKSYGRAIPRSI